MFLMQSCMSVRCLLRITPGVLRIEYRYDGPENAASDTAAIMWRSAGLCALLQYVVLLASQNSTCDRHVNLTCVPTSLKRGATSTEVRSQLHHDTPTLGCFVIHSVCS